MKGPDNPNWQGGISRDNMRYKREQKRRYPERVYARELVRRAVRSGRLVRQPCRCGDVRSFAHHHDYSKPLEVEWLCRACHRAEHVENPHPVNRPAPATPDTFEWRGRQRGWRGKFSPNSANQRRGESPKP